MNFIQEFNRLVSDGRYFTYLDGLQLNKSSIVFDVGTYLGASALLFSNKYSSKVYSFEPFETFFDKAKVQLLNHDNVKLFPFGLGKGNAVVKMSDSGDGTSSISGTGDKECQIRDFFTFLEQEQITTIDLLYINIEGGEYELLDYIYIQKTFS